jgi:hypothetical protein
MPLILQHFQDVDAGDKRGQDGALAAPDSMIAAANWYYKTKH